MRLPPSEARGSLYDITLGSRGKELPGAGWRTADPLLLCRSVPFSRDATVARDNRDLAEAPGRERLESCGGVQTTTVSV
jgi:hypothetical protein